ncbi:MAG TPA: hypothetical protein VK578_08620 [Edaphobacter sp.]|nr:hypothetical protein [Edaphobacter sp.]
MIRDHKFYEMQGALAATGQLTDAELTELEQHAINCASCHECIADMGEMSREFFLLQTRRMRSRATPVGMQERFLERAASAGIPVSRSISTLFDPRFARVAVIAVLLAISISLSWKVFLVPNAKREAPDYYTSATRPAPTSEWIAHTEGEQGARVLSTSKAQLKRRTTARRRAVSVSSAPRISEERHSYLELDRPLFANQGSSTSFSDGSAFWSERLAAGPLAAGLHAPIRTSFTNACVASCFGHREDSKPEGQAFHLDLKIASLSFLESPQNINAESHITSLKFSVPVFHLDPNRVW